MPSDSLNARAPLRLAAFGGKNYNGSRRVESRERGTQMAAPPKRFILAVLKIECRKQNDLGS